LVPEADAEEEKVLPAKTTARDVKKTWERLGEGPRASGGGGGGGGASGAVTRGKETERDGQGRTKAKKPQRQREKRGKPSS